MKEEDTLMEKMFKQQIIILKEISNIRIEMNERFEDLEAKMDKGFEDLNRKYDDLSVKVEGLDAKVEDLDGKYDSIHGIVARIEVNLKDKTGALFDSYTIFKDYRADNDQKIKRLENKVRQHSNILSAQN